jgi:hypothetical protein
MNRLSVDTLENQEIKGKVAARAASLPGFIHSLTSDSRQPQILLDPRKMRLGRLSKAVKTAARMHVEDLDASGKRYQGWFITTTYRDGVEWQPKHITNCIKNVRDWCSRLGIKFRYVWVSEIQTKRQFRDGGHCVHYHIMVFLPRHLQLPKFDKRGWWPHGATQTVKAIKPVGYMAKYASKGGDAGYFPKGCRLHGCGGLDLKSRWQKTWWMCPAYVREWWPEIIDRPARSPGGGWISKLSGDWRASKYKLISFSPLIIQEVVPA